MKTRDQSQNAGTVPPSSDIHPFLKGNFAPVETEFISFPCKVQGVIPPEFIGGQYIRNGGNPIHPPEKGRHYHWFDGDGMLHGVYFTPEGVPLYTNRHLATSLLKMTLLLLRSPIPSIALLISPLSSLHRIVAAILQSFFLALRARLGVLSVANTSVFWWGTTSAESDHRLLATCESGPPLEVRVPELETVGWDRLLDRSGESLKSWRGPWWKRFALSRIQEDWMTAHPRVDPVDGTLLFYSTQMFEAPHARYSVIDSSGQHLVWKQGVDIGRAKMMHDFAATRTHTILLNLPLTLAPTNLLSLLPLIHFDRSLPSEFVIFPRLLRSAATPQEPIRFTESEPCLIFHTANAWDEPTADGVAINMLACRFKSAKLVYAAGAIDIPAAERGQDVVQLHYYQFGIPQAYLNKESVDSGRISHSFSLMAIPFEFPTMPTHLSMSASRYVYGCTMQSGSFDERLGGAAKVDCLVKVNVEDLIRRGKISGDSPADSRTTLEILQQWKQGIRGPIEVFALPEGLYAQECQFVPRTDAKTEDDGYLVTYIVYDESNLGQDGTPLPDEGSELWIIDAKNMAEGLESVVCRIELPQRVPYGLHGTWIPASKLQRQRSHPPIEQPLLQAKLERSRLQHFVSILFDRPPDRQRSAFERLVLNVMWPMSVVMLLLALYEAARMFKPIRPATSSLSWPQMISLPIAFVAVVVFRSTR
ncbi:carotenoid oxygenase [Kockovaella imperatae]|uniref:Carotenoid oxygenase n=1 Tax=Kockovaella imperatae TaxID=4999 RepID=A0A1Y1UPB9_9TREE|nr:carotenoid oxygenase [Kockovaella imperatae]ORX39888.1 carotenoid oxygenase [Kockovaella imperatae]